MSSSPIPPRPPPLIYINGYPGIGKRTIGQQLISQLPHPAKLFDNHLLIDPVAALLDRHSPEYQPLRKRLRSTVFSAVFYSSELREATIVFTDQQSSSELGSSVAKEYEKAAIQRGSDFISIRLTCTEGENLRRATSTARTQGDKTKLTDVDILKRIIREEDIYAFGGKTELTIDVTLLSAVEAAI